MKASYWAWSSLTPTISHGSPDVRVLRLVQGTRRVSQRVSGDSGKLRGPDPNHGQWQEQRWRFKFKDRDSTVLIVGGWTALVRLKYLHTSLGQVRGFVSTCECHISSVLRLPHSDTRDVLTFLIW